MPISPEAEARCTINIVIAIRISKNLEVILLGSDHKYVRHPIRSIYIVILNRDPWIFFERLAFARARIVFLGQIPEKYLDREV